MSNPHTDTHDRRSAIGRWRITMRSASFGLLVLGLAFMPSCRVTDHSEHSADEITADALHIPASGYDEGDTSDLPHFAFDSTVMRFGQVAQGTMVEKVFRFINDGGSDLIITDVRGTCGCTVGKDWPKAPVHPGDGGTITVTFDSEGRSGLQDKTISVTANTQPPTTILLLKGDVVAPPTN